MTKKTALDRICIDFADEIEEFVEKIIDDAMKNETKL